MRSQLLAILSFLAVSDATAVSYEYNLIERAGLVEIEMTREALLWRAGERGWKFRRTYDETGAVVDRMISFSTENANFDALLDDAGRVQYLVEHAGTGVDFTLAEAFGAMREHLEHFTSIAGWEALRPVALSPAQRQALFNTQKQAVYAGFSIPIEDHVVAILLIEVPVGGPDPPVHDQFDVLIVYDFSRQLLGKRHHD